MRRARRLPSAGRLQLEAVLLAGGLRALLLQLARPGVGHGVAEHSDFARDPLGRLWSTLEFVYVVAAGDADLVARTARRVGASHRSVVGGADAATRYDARDPELQLWVAGTIHDTAVRIVEAVWGRLPDALADELLARDGRIATVLGVPAARWPADRAAFERWWSDAREGLGFDGVVLPVVAELIRARATPLPTRIALALLARATLRTLPPSLQPAIEPLLPRWAPDLLPLARRIAPGWRLLPPELRRLPARRILAAARERREADAAAVAARS